MTSVTSAAASLEKYARHLSALSAVPDSLCVSFLDLLRASPEAQLECSCKIRATMVHPLRMNLWYEMDRLPVLYPKIGAVLDRLATELPLDLSLYHDLIDPQFRYDRVRCSVFGIDARADPAASRIKLWHIIGDYPEMEERVFGFPGLAPEAHYLKIHPGLLFGFDFGLNGCSALKVYPVWHDFQICEYQGRLRDIVGAAAVALAQRCCRVSFGFSTADVGISAHMIPNDPAQFIADLKHPPLSATYQSLGISSAIVAMDLAEMRRTTPQTFNLYY
jgi:LynF/TruF/PatF family peptide O-prenyltransferase